MQDHCHFELATIIGFIDSYDKLENVRYNYTDCGFRSFFREKCYEKFALTKVI